MSSNAYSVEFTAGNTRRKIEYEPRVDDGYWRVNIADRYLSGESRFREHENDDDSAEDGGRLTAPQDSQADATKQETLGTYAS